MQSIEELEKTSLLQKLATAETSLPLSAGDDRLAEIKGFKTAFTQICRTPEVIRLLMYHEFKFDGQVDFTLDATKGEGADEDELLRVPWYPTSFVVPNYANMEVWIEKCILECETGRTVVAIIPARTNTVWFHKCVLGRASEIRFIRGRVTMRGHKSQNSFPDVVAVYKPARVASTANSRAVSSVDTVRKRGRLAIATSFNPGADSLKVYTESDGDDDEYEDEEDDE